LTSEAAKANSTALIGHATGWVTTGSTSLKGWYLRVSVTKRYMRASVQ